MMNTLEALQLLYSLVSCGVEPGADPVRYDWLAHDLFDSIEQIQAFATRWLWTDHNERPNMALGGITPRQTGTGNVGLSSTCEPH